MTSLYVLAQEYRYDANNLADLDIDEKTVFDTLDGMGGELKLKAANIMFLARNLEAAAEAIKIAEKAMVARRKAMEKRAEWLRLYVLSAMQITNIQQIECTYFKLSVRSNPPAVDVFDLAQLPAEFMHQPDPQLPSPDKVAIKEALIGGRDVPGCRLTVSQRLEDK